MVLKQELDSGLEHVYMRLEVNSDRIQISNHFEKSFRLHGSSTAVKLQISNCFQKLLRLHGDFTLAVWQTMVLLYDTCANYSF